MTDRTFQQIKLDKNPVKESTDSEAAIVEIGTDAHTKNKFPWWGVLCVLAILVPSAWYGHKELDARKKAEFKTACRESVAAEDWPGLIETASLWSAWDAEAADAWVYQAQGFQELGEPNRAVELLLRVPNHSEKAEAALLVAANLYFEVLGKPGEAVPILKRLLNLNQTSITAHQRLIFFYAITLQRVEMLAQIRKAIELGAEPPDAYVYQQLASRLTFSNGYQMTQQWLRNDPESELFHVAAAIHLSLARDLAENADDEPLAEKERRFGEVRGLLKQYPQSLPVLRYLLHFAISQNDTDDVGQLLGEVPADGWDDSVFWHCRGWYHHQFDELDEAEKAYRKSLELYPLDWETWHNFAATLRKLKDLDGAEQAQAIALQGKELRKKIQQLSDARAVSPEILTEMRDYCVACGDQLTAESLQTRIRLMTGYR